ncbi:copper ABC transporter ATP-binding protein [Steroidobacter denitrificans]|uniref:Copper ABC transporter ATP-binding protein n=1 Tax=Steroidobacter denitrificans TaxID=465721 RepID=A0A127FDP2_STEDE|nr:ABC transporter ATP-binding protein [Steroidobacter denitrificans]AMN47781.1 copper ABC transporter ATP-binding protein [Steroidobacter denitrificans]
MAGPVIEVRGAVKRFGTIVAVDGIDLDIEAGEVLGLIGRNGAGKSTLFKMMLGLIPPTAGEIRIDGCRVQDAAFREVRRRLGYLPENMALYDNLTGLETLRFIAALKDAPRGECGALLERVGLAHAADRRVKTYSKGMRQRLGFAQALLGRPLLLFLDEPTNGLDPEGIREFYQLVREQRDRGATIVLTSHILAEIQQRVDRLAILNGGKLQALGTLSSLRETMQLPLWFELRLAPTAHQALTLALAHIDGVTIDLQDEQASIRCARTDRMRILAALSGLGEQLTDLVIHEPSLEDVFLGHSDTRDAS